MVEYLLLREIGFRFFIKVCSIFSKMVKTIVISPP